MRKGCVRNLNLCDAVSLLEDPRAEIDLSSHAALLLMCSYHQPMRPSNSSLQSCYSSCRRDVVLLPQIMALVHFVRPTLSLSMPTHSDSTTNKIVVRSPAARSRSAFPTPPSCLTAEESLRAQTRIGGTETRVSLQPLPFVIFLEFSTDSRVSTGTQQVAATRSRRRGTSRPTERFSPSVLLTTSSAPRT